MLEVSPAHGCAQSAGTARDPTRGPARISTTFRESEINDGTRDLRLHAAAEVRPALFWDVTQHKIPQDRSTLMAGVGWGVVYCNSTLFLQNVI